MRSLDGIVGCDLEDMEVLVYELELPPPPLPELSSSEGEVALLVGDGLSNAAIARARGVSQRTVASQLRSVFHKLGLRSRWALALWLTRRAVAVASWTNVQAVPRLFDYEPFGTTRVTPSFPWSPAARLLDAVVAMTGGPVANRRPPEPFRMAHHDAISIQTRTLLRASMAVGRIPRVAEVAAALALSVRSLQRQLRSEGCSFRTLLTEVRLAEARRRLQRGASHHEVARALSYTSAASLRRALR